MKNKLIFALTLAMVALFAAGFASAIVPNYAPYAGGIGYGYASYGSHPVNPSYTGINYAYASQPVRIGGFYGQNSAFLIGLKPGFYDSPSMNGYNRNRLASNYYPRAGGYFGQGYTSNLRPGTFTYTGGKTYTAPNYHFAGTM